MAVMKYVVLLNKDVPKAARFYAHGLGLAVTVCSERWAELRSGPFKIALMQAPSGTQPAVGHSSFLSFNVTDMESTVTRLLSMGAELDGPIKYPPHGKLVDVNEKTRRSIHRAPGSCGRSGTIRTNNAGMPMIKFSILSNTSGEMMVQGLILSSPAVTGRPLISALASSSSAVAPHHGRTSCGANPPGVIVLALQVRLPFSTILNRRLANSEFAGPLTLSSSDPRKNATSSAAYGPSNGNGRPGGGVQKSGDGYNSGFLTGDPEILEGQSPDNRQDLEGEKASDTPARKGGKSFGPRGGAAPSRSEKEGDDPYRVLENGQKVYLDELDVVTLLEPPPFLRPLQSVYYNHAAFLWKKIGDIPEERRHRLLELLLPRHITKMWELSKLRYEDPEAFDETAADMLPGPNLPDQGGPTVWDGRVTQVPWYLTPFSRFQKVFFVGGDNKVYGRVITGGKFVSKLSDRLAPLYFEVMHADSVMATEEPCDIALEYGDGQLHLRDSLPPGFAKPGKHLPPFNDKACDYLRAVGPGVMVGQGWVEGRKLEQFPRRLFGEFIMVQKFR